MTHHCDLNSGIVASTAWAAGASLALEFESSIFPRWTLHLARAGVIAECSRD